MNEKIKNNEISEENLEQVNGGRRVVVGDGKMGTCKKCGTYAYIIDGLVKNAEINKTKGAD